MKKGIIHKLSESAINRIAAGEVIFNAASAVKELVENAVDAGAKNIRIEILGGGLQTIRIIDDGKGMSSEDALLCLERHATSKIQEPEDLFALHTMGFRGEALSSIAAISKLTLNTSALDGEGTMVYVEGGKITHVHPSARPQGTTIEVNALFYNVPARKKFQKKAAASSAEITQTATLLALAHPHISFELVQQRKRVFLTHYSDSFELSSVLLQRRSQELLGEDFQSHMHAIDSKESLCAIYGWIAGPQKSRHNRSGQYLFVNHRPVFCPPLAFAIRDGYGTRLDTHRHPLYVMHLLIPPAHIDVNVHPQKKEIRLSEESVVKHALRQAVGLAFQRSLAADIPQVYPNSLKNREFGKEAAQIFGLERATIVRAQGASEDQKFAAKLTQPTTDSSSCLGIDPNNLKNREFGEEAAQIFGLERATIVRAQGASEDQKFAAKLIQQKTDSSGSFGVFCLEERIKPEVQISNDFAVQSELSLSSCIENRIVGVFAHYLLLIPEKGQEEGMVWLDLLAAQQRILFERLLAQKKEELASQSLLIPLIFTCSKAESAQLLALSPFLEQLGLHIRLFGPDSFVIESIPCYLQERDIHDFLHEIIAEGKPEEEQLNTLAKKMCRMLPRHEKVFSHQEAIAVFKELMKTDDPHHSPQGKPTFYLMKKEEIASYFV